nr:MAG TPA: hypothetical protein [Bacteriophage sp.]
MSIFIPFILCFSKLYHFNRQYSIFNVQIVAVGVEPTRPKQGSTAFESANSTRRSVFR